IASGTIKYPAIIKVGKKDDDVYLFISKRQGYIVDVSALSEIELLALKALVTAHLPARKVKWK
ncbi:MAG: YcxB family protein, partial [Clostridia bacterium]|nr:YcxB family protein [Clostridia bacterium]